MGRTIKGSLLGLDKKLHAMTQRGSRRSRQQRRMEWQGEATCASITVTGGSRLHLKLPGNYHLDHQWRDDHSATLQLTFTTRPHPSPFHSSHTSEDKNERNSFSLKLLGYIILIVFLCLLLLLTIDFWMSLNKYSQKSTVSQRDSNYTREQLIATGRIPS